jgi:transcriptional regulator with XRE-family HTH domain
LVVSGDPTVIAARVRYLRDLRGLSQDQLVALSGSIA